MAIANLHETLLAYTMRKNQINLDISALQGQKALAVLQTTETNSLLAAGKADLRDFYKQLYKNDEENYKAQGCDNYEDIPEFEADLDKLIANINDELAEIAAWEEQIDSEITSKSTELEEIKAYEESIKTMLSSNIQEDFNYGLNG